MGEAASLRLPPHHPGLRHLSRNKFEQQRAEVPLAMYGPLSGREWRWAVLGDMVVWGVPAGSMDCCWKVRGVGGGGVGVFVRQPARSVNRYRDVSGVGCGGGGAQAVGCMTAIRTVRQDPSWLSIDSIILATVGEPPANSCDPHANTRVPPVDTCVPPATVYAPPAAACCAR
eukprot:366462-Chlamydomonas_euryale.AAC.6